MESIPAFQAKTHLSQLLERTARGEEFTILKHGKPVARLVPVPATRSVAEVEAAVAAMREFARGRTGTAAEIREWIEDGRRF